MVNLVILVGHLGKDPEIRYTQDGAAVCNFSIATSETRKDRNGEKKKLTEWHKIVAFRKLAEICNQFLQKGSLIYLEGKLQTRTWEDKDGNKRSTTEIRMDVMKMLGDSRSAGNSKTDSQGSGDKAPWSPEDNVPF